MKKKSKVFISYAHADRQFVDWLAKKLKESGAEVWVDIRNIKVGDSIIHRIEEGIGTSDFLIVVLSQASVRSPWVREELGAATTRNIDVEKRTFILPILIEDCEIPTFLRHRKYADFKDDREQGFQELVEVIWRETAITPEQQPGKPKKTLGSTGDLFLEGDAGTQVDIFKIRADLASLLSIPSDEMLVSMQRTGLLHVEMPSEAAERLMVMHEKGDLFISSLDTHPLRITRKEYLSAMTYASSGAPPISQRLFVQDTHTFRISLMGQAIQGINNQLKLVVDNTSPKNYRRVTIQFVASDSAISLRPTQYRFALEATSNKSLPITLKATQPGTYEIQVRASSIPAPPDGFLRTALQIKVDPAPPRSVIEIRFV